MTTPTTPADLVVLQRLAMSPATGSIPVRNALMRCARTVAQALRSADDTAEIPIVTDPYADQPAPERKPPRPIE